MAIHPIHGVGGTTGPAGPASQAGGAGAAGHRPADTVDVSPEAALLRRLDALAKDSPERFRAVAEGVAVRLGAEARVADPARALPLAILSERFAAAALAGAPGPLTAPAPTAGPPGGAHPAGLAPPAHPVSAGAGVPPEAGLAAAALAAGAAAGAKLERSVRRAAYRPQRHGGEARADEPAASAQSPLGALLAAVREIVEWALEAALREAPPEGSPRPRGP